jgi:two-component system nitrate/nitrite response regulator NarL
MTALSPRERDVLAGIVRGYSDKEIGAELGIAYQTVKVYALSLYRKIGVKNRVGAAVWAVRNEQETDR